MRVQHAIACLVVLAATQTHAQQPSPLRGRVVDADTGAPLAHVRVSEVGPPVPAPEAVEQVVTNERGEFVFSRRPLVIGFAKAGYARTNAPVAAGGTPLEFKLPRGAAIIGRVVDGAGAPVSGLFVGVFEIAGAIEASRPVGTVMTNDLGEYRVGDLKAGRYRVRFTDDPVAPAVDLDVRAGDEVDAMPVTRPAPCAPADPPPLSDSAAGKGALRGRITTTAGIPLACTTVSVLGNGAPIRRSSTDPQGRFAFTDLKAASYFVTATRPGYTVLQYGQERSGQEGKLVAVTDGRAVTDINIALPRGSAITGTITDETGDPVEGAQVRVLKLAMVDGRQAALAPQSTGTQRSDDRGRYRLFGLLPGRYLVSVTGDDGISTNVSRLGAIVINNSQPAGLASAPMFYPGTPDPSLAALLTVEPGRDLAGIDVSLRPVQGGTITGKAFDSEGQPLRSGVLLAVSQRSGGIMLEPRQARVDASGSFSFRNVPPGEYVLQAMAPRAQAAPDFVAEFVRVADSDPLPIVLRTSPGPTIEGRIVREGPDAPDLRFMVFPFPTDFDRSPMIGMGMTGVTVQPDGAYRAAGMSGVRRMMLASAPDGWYLKSVLLKGRDITDEAYDFGSKPEVFGDVQFVVSNAAATVDCDVRDRGDRVGNYSLLLFSTDRSLWYRNSRHMKATDPVATAGSM